MDAISTDNANKNCSKPDWYIIMPVMLLTKFNVHPDVIKANRP